jgi:hypothetical protein
MECLRSFSFSTNVIDTLTTGGSELKQWTTSAGNHYWQAITTDVIANPSIYNIEGFKNIDVYGIDVIGDIQTQANIGINGVIVNDWSIDVSIEGQQPLIGGTTVGGYYGIDSTLPDNNIFALGKYTNSLKLASPIISAKSITLGRTRAAGIAYQTAGAINLFWKVNFVVYYKFQGE